MAFPPGDVSLIDQFTRADGAVYAGAGAAIWGTQFVNGDASALMVSANTMVTSSVDGGGITLESETDFIRIFELAATSGGYVAFGWRLQNVGSGTFDSYAFLGQGTTWKISRYDNGVATEIASTDVSSSLSPGNKIGVKVVGSLHEVYLYAGAWNDTPVMSVTDATYAGPGAFWFEFSNTTWRIDNYTAGSMDVPTEPVTIIVDPDHAAAADTYTRLQAADPATPMRTANAACYLARATPDWADTILVKACASEDLGDAKDPRMQPQLDHRWTDRSDAVVGWPFGDNTGNQTIVVRGDVTVTSLEDVQTVALPKILKFQSRGLSNWRFENLQGGYDIGSGHDYSTLSSMERMTDLEFRHCLSTGGLGIAAWWAGDLKVTECAVHSPLPPDGGNPGFHDGAGLRTERAPNDSNGGFSVGRIYVEGCEFSNIRGDDGVTVGGVFEDDPLYDVFDMQIRNTLFYNVTEGANPAFHTDSIQALAVPRCLVENCTFIGCATSFLASDGRNGQITFQNNLVVAAGSPFQMQGTDEVVIHQNTFFHTTPLIDATLLFYDRATLPQDTLATITNNILGGFFMRDRQIADYFRAGSAIEDNIVISHPGMVTAFGVNLPGIPEFGHSARLDVIPNDTVSQGVLPRTWELANVPGLSPGIGQGQATAPTGDLFGRAYADPPDVGCLQSDAGTPVTPIARPPYVISETPSAGATGVSALTLVQLVLYPKPGAAIAAGTVDASTFYATGPSSLHLPSTAVTVTGPDVSGRYTLTLTIDGELLPWVVYSAFATSGIEDSEGSALAPVSWSFRVAGSTPEIQGATGDPDAAPGTHTMQSPWPAGTLVRVYPVAGDGLPSGSAPSGPAVSSGTVGADSIVSFSGLREGVRYIAWADGFGVRFLVPAPIYKVVRVA